MITNFIQLDFNKENDLKVPSVQYDSGSRFVKIKLQQNKVPFNINGYRVTVVANKVDGTEIMNDCTILDGDNGLVEFEITEQFNAVKGVVDCQLKLFKDEILLTSMPFSINVVKSVSTKEIVSSNELKTLVNALGEVQNIDNRFAQTNAQLSKKMNRGEEIVVSQINKNKGKIDQTYLSDDLLQTISGNAPVHSVPVDGGVTTEKLANNSITAPKLDGGVVNWVKHHGYRVLGKFETVQFSSDGYGVTVTWQRMYLRVNEPTAVKDYKIAVNTEPITVGNNQFLYADLSQAINGDEYELKVGSYETVATTPAENIYIVFQIANGRYGGDLALGLLLQTPDKSIRGGLLADTSIVERHLAKTVINRVNRSTYDVMCAYNSDWEIKNSTMTIKNVGRIYIYLGATDTEPIRVENKDLLEIPNHQCAYVDLDETELLSDGTYPIRVTSVDMISAVENGTMGFAQDRKIILWSNKYGIIGGKLAGHLLSKNEKVDAVSSGIRPQAIWYKMDTKPVYWDETSKTLTWEGNLLCVIGYAPPGNGNRVKIAPGSHTFEGTSSGYTAMYLDLNEITEREFNDPNICIKSGSYHLNGYSPINTNIPIAKYDKFDTGFEVINFVDVQTYGNNEVVEGEFIFDENIHVVIEADKNVQILRQCSYGNGEYYLCQNFGHHVSPSISCDIWKLDEVYVYKKTGDKFSKVYANPMIKAGEWECALKEKGAVDFIGGVAHGDEMLTSVKFLLDGKNIDLTKSGSYLCKNITVIEHSKLFRCDSLQEDHVANHIRYYDISKNEIIVTQRVTWLQSLTMERSYLTMLPICRQYGYNGGETAQPEKPYITSMGITDYDYVPMELRFDGDKHSNYVHKKGIKMAQIWNDGTGYQMTAKVEILESNDLPNSSMAFTNSGQYNKMYFDYCGSDYVTSVNEVWKNKAKYTYDFKGYID